MKDYYIIDVSYDDSKTGKCITRHLGHYGSQESAFNRCERVKNMYQERKYVAMGIKNVTVQLLHVLDYESLGHFLK